MYQTIIEPPKACRWWNFDYSDKAREALVLGNDVHGNLFCWTPDGFRSFKPAKMIGIEDRTCVTT